MAGCQSPAYLESEPMVLKIIFTIMALLSLADVAVAVATFDHVGDWHMSWGTDALTCAGMFFYLAFRNS